MLVWSMFGLEQMWGCLTRWMTQTSHPEASMINFWKAYIAYCQAPFHYLPENYAAPVVLQISRKLATRWTHMYS